MDNDDKFNWHQFWEHTREILNRGEVPGGEIYEQLTQQASSRAVTYEEFYYLLSRYPALIIRHPEAGTFAKQRPPTIVSSKSHWEILDFGDWLCSAPGRLLWGAYSAGNQAETAPKVVKGTGTLVQQYVDTAYDMIVLAIEKGWPAAQVVHGFYGMIRAAWIAAEGLQFRLEGFSPTLNDQVVLSWVNQLLDKRQKEVAKRIKMPNQQIDPSS